MLLVYFVSFEKHRPEVHLDRKYLPVRHCLVVVVLCNWRNREEKNTKRIIMRNCEEKKPRHKPTTLSTYWSLTFVLLKSIWESRMPPLQLQWVQLLELHVILWHKNRPESVGWLYTSGRFLFSTGHLMCRLSDRIKKKIKSIQ